MNLIQEVLQQFEYPGRFLVIGEIDAGYLALYGVTARSASSKTKRYVLDEDKSKIGVIATDADIMAQGDLSLLEYAAVHFFDNGLVIGNGRQTDQIMTLQNNAVDQLRYDLKNISYEPDKYLTPRITGCIVQTHGIVSAGLHIARAKFGTKNTCEGYAVSLDTGKGAFICTYAGPNVRPTPSFVNDPIDVTLDMKNAKDAVRQIYDAIAPKEGHDDLRVSVMAIVYQKDTFQKDIHIINAVDEINI